MKIIRATKILSNFHVMLCSVDHGFHANKNKEDKKTYVFTVIIKKPAETEQDFNLLSCHIGEKQSWYYS